VKQNGKEKSKEESCEEESYKEEEEIVFFRYFRKTDLIFAKKIELNL
jgi:hypothetical protein